MESMATTAACQYCGALTNLGPYCCNACEMLALHVRPLPVLSEKQNAYSYLDQTNFREIYQHKNKKDFNYLFFAEGLHCSSCVHLLEKLPTFYDQVLDARVNFSQSTVSIKLSDSGSLAQVAHVIEELGYKPTPLSDQDNVSENYNTENRTFLKRIAVAGFCAGNTMLFVIPVYSGLAGSWAQIFNWLSFFLFLPILLYSAVPFYKGAWNSLKYHVVNVDLPIVIALSSGFVLSSYNLVRGDGAIYFDSTASFMFFILSARYLLKRVQQNYLSPSRLKSFFQSEKYLKLTDENEIKIPWSHIQVGDTLRIFRNQNLPSDCELISTQATLDMSLFNGEAMPKVFSRGMKLFGGTKVLDTEILVRITDSFKHSKLGLLLEQLDEGALVKSRFVAITDRLAQKLILTVFGIAILFFLIYARFNPSEAFNRSLALIVLACPCALAFGSPLAFGMALKKAQKMGILLKDATSLERILKVKNIFFDKTGTLTEGSLSLSHSEPTFIDVETQKIILSLEMTSYHPIAFALRKSWPHPSELFSVQNHKEILGQGVRGVIGDNLYEIKHLAESTHEAETAIELTKNNQLVCRLYFKDTLRAEAPESIKKLLSEGYSCFLVSGDKKARVQKIAQECKIKSSQAFGELFPEDKMEIIQQHPHSCMIGDGANDSLSLKSADVGIAVKGSVDLSLSSADIYFSRGGLTPFFDLLVLAKQTRHVLIRNLTISIIYNTIGGVLALAGFINPMLAAILMPLSSLAIILSSIWGFK